MAQVNDGAGPRLRPLTRAANKDGQTEFCKTIAASDALPEEEKAATEGLRVMHTLRGGVRDFIGPNDLNPIRGVPRPRGDKGPKFDPRQSDLFFNRYVEIVGGAAM